jgi:ankyrin repeat protein
LRNNYEQHSHFSFSSQMSPLMLAVSKGHFEIMKLLVASKADVAAKDRCQTSALHLSIDCETQTTAGPARALVLL